MNPGWTPDQARVLLSRPRFARRHGVCPSCGRGWTDADFCDGVWKGSCAVCERHGPITVDDRIEFIANDLELAIALGYEAELFNETGGLMKRTPTLEPAAAPAPALLFLWENYRHDPRTFNPLDPAVPPGGLMKLPVRDSIRCILTSLELTVERLELISPEWRNDANARANLARRILVAHVQRDDAASDRVAAGLADLFVEDLVERAKWARALHDVDHGDDISPLMLRDASLKLMRAGDLLTLLRHQRDALDARIALLEGRRTAGARS